MDQSQELHVTTAHLFEKKARDSAQKLKFQVAFNYMTCAVDLYEKALELGSNPKAIQSIKLEMESAQKQKDMYKKQQIDFENVMKTLKMENRPIDMEMDPDSDEEENEQRTRVVYERMTAVLMETIEKKNKSCRELRMEMEEAEAKRDALRAAKAAARAARNSKAEATSDSSS